MRLALLFPGQGSQYVSMGTDLAAAFPEARMVLQEAESVLGYDLGTLCAAGPEETLSLTQHAQPAILTVSVMALRALGARASLQPVALAGHSLGEYTALVAAGTLEFADALRVVRARGQLMQAAVPVGAGAMAAIVGVDDGDVETLCAAARSDGEVLEPANVNGGGQVVLAGHAAAVERVVTLAKAWGAKLARRLAVSAPFHCELMRPAAMALGSILAETPLRAPQVPVLSNVDGAAMFDPAAIRERLCRQVERTVRWDRCMRTLADLGCVEALEVGPGNVLSSLARRMGVGIASRPVGTAAAIERMAAGRSA